jgi:hypothetical protein
VELYSFLNNIAFAKKKVIGGKTSLIVSCLISSPIAAKCVVIID